MRRNDDTPFGCYIIFFIIIFIIFAISNCNDEKRDEENQKKSKKTQQIKTNYINKFDFKLDIFSKEIEDLNLEKFDKSTPKKPIIIFKKRRVNNKNQFSFYYDLNKKLQNDFMSFSNDEINTIVIITDTLINIGNYSRTNKIAFKNNIVITYIDNKTKKVILQDYILGDDPPQEIKYYEKDESNKVYGKRPNESEILEKVLSNLR